MIANPPLTDPGKIGLVLLDPDFRVIGINDFAGRTLELSKDHLGGSIYDYHPEPSRVRVAELLRHAQRDQSGAPETMIIDVLGKVLLIGVSRMDMADPGKAPFLVATLWDVTEQTQAEMNLGSGLVQLKRIPVYENESLFFLDPGDIYFIRSEGNYCQFFTLDGVHFVHMTLKYALDRCAGTTLIRVHKSYAANIARIDGLERDAQGRSRLVFEQADLPPVPVARRRLSLLKSMIG